MLDSRSPLRLVIAGTGTGVGKTHVGCALLRHFGARGRPAVGLKPIETGLAAGQVSDQCRLSDAAMGRPLAGGDRAPAFHVKRPVDGRGLVGGAFHVKPSPYWFEPPIGPHLAAKDSGKRIDLGLIRAWVLEAQQRSDGCAAVVETAGGLFTPLAPRVTNLDLVLALEPAFVVLVAPDRLGVLHEVTATIGLAGARGRPIDAVVLSEPLAPDQSSGRNAAEIDLLGIARISAVFPRASEVAAGTDEAASRVVAAIDRRVTQRDGPRRA
jgi:dethiobiotin synthetase